jgi:hypothetical protein
MRYLRSSKSTSKSTNNENVTEITIFFPINRKKVTFSLILIKDAVLFFGKNYGHFSVKFSTKCELFTQTSH